MFIKFIVKRKTLFFLSLLPSKTSSIKIGTFDFYSFSDWVGCYISKECHSVVIIIIIIRIVKNNRTNNSLTMDCGSYVILKGWT